MGLKFSKPADKYPITTLTTVGPKTTLVMEFDPANGEIHRKRAREHAPIDEKKVVLKDKKLGPRR